MRTKLHFGIIIVLLAFLGRFIETPATPNQEITLQFSDVNVTKIEVQNALQDIQQKLQRIGAENFVVSHDDSGNLKIAYYSVTDAQSIEQILSNNSDFNLLFGVDSNTSNKNSDTKIVKDYKLNVSEIKKDSQTNDWDFDRVQITEHNQKTDRFNTIKKVVSGYLNQVDAINQLTQTAFKINASVYNVSGKKTYCIPEVRAGPLA